VHQVGFIYEIDFSFKLTILVKSIGTSKVVPVNAVKASGGVKVQLHIFLFPALYGDQLHAPAALPTGKQPVAPTAQEAEWAQSQSGEDRSLLPLP
jgi:hypothetical protein